jgi:hypothetical protein
VTGFLNREFTITMPLPAKLTAQDRQGLRLALMIVALQVLIVTAFYLFNPTFWILIRR